MPLVAKAKKAKSTSTKNSLAGEHLQEPGSRLVQVDPARCHRPGAGHRHVKALCPPQQVCQRLQQTTGQCHRLKALLMNELS